MIQCMHACSLSCLPFIYSFLSFPFPSSTLSDTAPCVCGDPESEPREPEWGMRSVSPVSQSAGGHQHASIKHQTEHIEDFIYKIFFVHISNRVCLKTKVIQCRLCVR